MPSSPRTSVGRRRLAVACASALFAGFIGARDASAYERQWHAGLDAGYLFASFPDGRRNGFDAGATASYGLTDAFNLRASADVGHVFTSDPKTRATFVGGALGAEYVFDVLRWVPYVGLTAGPNIMLRDNEPTRVRLGVEIPAGLGYQLSRSWSVGAEFRYRVLMLGHTEGSPSQGFLGLARCEFAWGS